MASSRKKLVKLAKAHGWKVEINRRGHTVFESPEGERIYTSTTPSDRRGELNNITRLRRAGLPVPHKGGRENERGTHR